MMSRKAEEDPEELLEMEEDIGNGWHEESRKYCQFAQCRSNRI